MRIRLPLCFLALVALEAALLNELLCLGAKITIVPIDEFPLLGIIDWMPFGTNVNTTRKANLPTRLQRSGR